MVRNLYKTERRRMMKSKAKRGRKVVDDIFVITGPSSNLKIVTNTYSTSPYKLYMKYKYHLHEKPDKSILSIDYMFTCPV